MAALSRRQSDVLGTIRRLTVLDGRVPTYRCVAERMGIAVSTVHDHVAALKRKGALPNGPLGIGADLVDMLDLLSDLRDAARAYGGGSIDLGNGPFLERIEAMLEKYGRLETRAE